MKFNRLPRHIGVIPDGNRRWAEGCGFPKEAGYSKGINPGFKLYNACLDLGIEEMTFYGFTQDNTKRPVAQRVAFQKACVEAVKLLCNKDASLLVVGNTDSSLFPDELRPYTSRSTFGKGRMKVNFLVNYSWWWDLAHAFSGGNEISDPRSFLPKNTASKEISRIELIIRH